MTYTEIDHISQKFYESVCFSSEKFPNVSNLKSIFYGDGKLVNGNFDNPLEFTLNSYIQAIMHQIDEGNAVSFSQQEIADETVVFGNTAHRTSVYEYTNSHKLESCEWIRGINFMQFILIDGAWKITSMIWSDETDVVKIPEMYLDKSYASEIFKLKLN